MMGTIIRSTTRLLFRNKGFWFFILITPMLSTFILREHTSNFSTYELDDETTLIELEQESDKVAYHGGKGKYVVKVYDAAESELSEYLLNKITKSGIVLVCRAKTPQMTKAEADSRAKIDGAEDRMGSAIYLSKDFDEKLLSGDIKNALVVYDLSDDERDEILSNEIKLAFSQIHMAAAQTSSDTASVLSVLKKMDESIPSKTVETFSKKDSVDLTKEQADHRTQLGYAFAFLTLGYVFGGIFIAHTVIRERQDMVLTRMRLTNLSDVGYFSGKLISGCIVSFLMTVIMGGCSFVIDSERFGISRLSFLVMVFLLGLIFCTISLMIGILLGNAMSANIAAFTLWSMSSMLAGLYFPLDSTNDAVKTLSYMMPQRWFMNGTERMMVGDNKGFLLLLGVTASYLVIAISLGSVGIKYRNNE